MSLQFPEAAFTDNTLRGRLAVMRSYSRLRLSNRLKMLSKYECRVYTDSTNFSQSGLSDVLCGQF